MRRIQIILGGIIAFAFVAFFLVSSTSGGAVRPGAGERTPAERREALSEGRCAVRHNGVLVGKVVGTLTPSRGNPRLRYFVEAADKRSVYHEVRIIPCATLDHE